MRLVCHICFNHITPESKFSCRETCLQAKKPFSRGICSQHKSKFIFGDICLLCDPYIKVCSVKLSGPNIDYNNYLNVLYECTENDGVLSDLFGLSTNDYDLNKYRNLLDSDSDIVLLGGGHNVVKDKDSSIFLVLIT